MTTHTTGDAAAGAPVGATTVSYSPQTGAPVSTERDGKVVTTRYDAWGRVVETVDASGNAGTVVYDVASQPVVSNDGIADTTYSYDTARDGDRLGEHRGVVTRQVEDFGAGVPGTWTAAYGTTGGPQQVVAPNGVVDSRTYEVTGALRTKAYTDHTGAPLMPAWTQAYNVHGQVATETGPYSSGSYVSTFIYDTATRLIADTFTPTDGSPVSRAYTVNANSDRTTLTTTTRGGTQPRGDSSSARWLRRPAHNERLMRILVSPP